jgi:thiosulfate/3-mercaptopyruvate sulfurtransferase
LTYHDIHPAELDGLLGEPDLLIFDIRDPGSYARGRLDGAVPADEAAVRQLVKSRQRQRPILVYCYHGNSSRELCEFIAGFGYQRVHNLVGGWQAWEQHRAAPVAGLASWLAERGFPPDGIHARIDNGMSPLMVAALKGERPVVEALLAQGADPNHVNDDDHHALWFACVHGDPDLVSRLIAHGANVDNQNVNGATCAIYAASTGKLEVLRRLVEAGADLRLETTGGYNALDSASTLPALKFLRGCAIGKAA